MDWNVSVDSSIVPAHQHSATAKRSAREDRTVLDKHTGAVWNDKNPPCCRDEPGDHALGRSRGDKKTHRKRIGTSGGRPVSYDRTACRGRNVIERAFNSFKHWRGLATRYDKHAIVYRGGLVLAAVLLWLTDLGDTS